MQALKILIVDDSLIMISNLTQLITEMGHEVIGTARSGSEAVTKFKKLNPDMITMDITMGDISGIETVEKIMNINPNMIIIMVTSHGQEKMVIDSIGAGAKGYLLKPIRYDNLKKVITDVYKKYGNSQNQDQKHSQSEEHAQNQHTIQVQDHILSADQTQDKSKHQNLNPYLDIRLD